MSDRRPGPGRPSKGRTVKRTLRITPDVAAWLERCAATAGPRVSVDDLIEAWAMESMGDGAPIQPDVGPLATPEPPEPDQDWQDEVQADVAARLAR